MDQDPMTSSAEPTKRNAEKTRKPYAKPAFRYERVFETMALACGKIGVTSPGCAGAPKAS